MAELRGEVMSGPARRRRWSAEEKAALVAEASRPGMSLSLVARRYAIARSVLLRWRRQHGDRAPRSGFVAVRVAPAPATLPAAPSPRRAAREGSSSGAGLMEIALGSGIVIRFGGDVDVGVLARVVEALGR